MWKERKWGKGYRMVETDVMVRPHQGIGAGEGSLTAGLLTQKYKVNDFSARLHTLCSKNRTTLNSL